MLRDVWCPGEREGPLVSASGAPEKEKALWLRPPEPELSCVLRLSVRPWGPTALSG